MGKKPIDSKTKINSQATCKMNLSHDSDHIQDLLFGKTQKLTFPAFKKIITSNLTQKPENKYRYPEKIGEGGMKDILKVKDHDTARNLAMAVLSDNSKAEESYMARFIHEARITANLEHPNIVPIHDIGIDKDGQPYFTMKLIEGENLAQLLINISKDTPGYRINNPLPHLLTIFINICNAIDFAHSKGIIHLDLKPENIQIGNYGEVLVLDWGLAKMADFDYPEDEVESALTPDSKQISNNLSNSNIDKTVHGEIKGTPGFMAPEQASGDNHKKNHTTDIYSLGALLYSILTLKRPIRGKEINTILNKTINGELTPPLERSPERNIPPALSAITMKAMSLNQDDRYQHTHELIKDIEAYTNHYATTAESPNLLKHINMFLKRHKLETFFIILAIIAITTLFFTLSHYETKKKSHWGVGKDITPTDNDELKREWLPINGNWEVRDNALWAMKGEDNSFILLYDTLFHGNIAIEFDAEIPNPKDLFISGDLSVILAASKNEPKKLGYFLQIGGLGNTNAIIQKRGGQESSVEFTLEPTRQYKIRAEKEGPNLRLYCDGELLLSSKDIFYIEGGYLGLYTFGSGKKFSNIKIYTKDVPELVPPTIEGDSFYRESRKTTGEEKKKFLLLAKKAYSKVYDSNLNSELSSEALLKRAYINSELNELHNALHDTILLDGFGKTINLLLLKGMLAFKSKNFDESFNIYNEIIVDYPESKITTLGVIMERLSSKDAELIPPQLRQKFWNLCASNNNSSAFRCSSKYLNSIDFLKDTNFNLIDCSDNKITNLDPLKNRKIEKLDCADNMIISLSPLKSLKLTSLECHNNPITDISPLQNMPLKTLTLNGCTKLKNIDILKNCKTLEKLTLPTHIKDIDFLKKLPNLKYINYEWDNFKMTSKEFFKKYKINKLK